MRDSTISMKWIALLAFGGMGLTALISGLVWGGNRYVVAHNGIHTRGQVVEFYKSEYTTTSKERREGRSNVEVTYYPVVEFYDQKEKKIRFRGATGEGVPEFELGTPVAVVYDPEKPYEALIDTFSHVWLGPLVLSIAGSLLLSMGVALYYLIGQPMTKT